MAQAAPACVQCAAADAKLKLLAATCGHRFCEPCVQAQTLKGSGWRCPTCNVALSRMSFRQGGTAAAAFEQASFQHETKVRKRLARIFNKTRADFDSDRAFYDYEEMVEDVTFNLVHGIDKQANEARVQQWMRDNQAAIVERNKEADVRHRQLREQLVAEQALVDRRREEMLREAAEETRERRLERERLLRRVQLGQLDAGAAALEDELEAGLKRRLKKKQALDNGEEDGGPVAPGAGQRLLEATYAPSQIEAAKHIPKPVGMTMHAAARAEDQKRIVSHRGLLSRADMDALLETCKCTGYSRDILVKRGREMARSVFIRE